jgi:hypothetical protein
MMKYKIILYILVIIYADRLFAQGGTSTVAMGEEFAAFGGTPVKRMDTRAYQSYSNNQVLGSPYFLPDWHKGEVITSDKQVFSDGFMFSYNKFLQELFIRTTDSSTTLLGDKNRINGFTLTDGDKQYHFANSSLFSSAKPFVYYQVLVYDSSKITLLKLVFTSFVKADKNDMMKLKEGDIFDAYVDNNLYYIVKGGGAPVPIELKSKSFRKVFSDLRIDSKKYMDAHYGPFDEDYLIALVRQLNQ